VSPVVASMYCSPHPAVLHIAPAARLREFCLYDSAPGELICEDDCQFIGRDGVYARIVYSIESLLARLCFRHARWGVSSALSMISKLPVLLRTAAEATQIECCVFFWSFLPDADD